MNKNEKYDEFQVLYRMRELAGVKENGNINVLTEAKTDLEQLTSWRGSRSASATSGYARDASYTKRAILK